MKFKKHLSGLILLFSLTLVFSLNNITNALTISGGTFDLELSPGEVYKDTVVVKNPSDQSQFIEIKLLPTVISEETGRRLTIDPSSKDYEGVDLLTDWIDLSSKEIELDSGENEEINVNIAVPEDINPGAYHAIMRFEESAAAENDDEGSTIGVSAAIAKTINVLIPGDAERNIELVNFEVDEEKLQEGDVVFLSTFKNTGDVPETPTARIEIYNKEGEQIKDIIKTVREDGTVETKDFINVSFPAQYLFPDSEVTVETEWLNRNLKPGNYTARITGHWGPNQIPFSAETEVSVAENIEIIDFGSSKGWYQSLPATFEGTVTNNNTRGVKYNAKLIIKNLFGVGVYEKDITKNNGVLLGNKDLKFTEEELVWDANFALGSYTAVLKINYGENANILEASSTFFVMTWWQIIIGVIILALIIFLIYKGVKSYKNLKKKVEKIEEK